MSTKGEILFINWHKELTKLLPSAQKTKGKSLLKNQREEIICNPAKLALCAQEIAPHPQIGKQEWDSSFNLSLFRNSGKLYRRFAQRKKSSTSKLELFKYRFLVYKRYNSINLYETLPSNSRGQCPSGLQGTTELLYSPHANLPKTGRPISNQHGNPVIESREDFDDTKKLVGETLTLSELIPIGNEGFYIFCSAQQKNPYKIEQGQNERMVIGPNGPHTRVRVAHMIRKLSNGKPEDTPSILQAVEETCGDILLNTLEKIVREVEDPQEFFQKNQEELQAQKKKWETEVIKEMTSRVQRHITLTISPNTVGIQGGGDSCIILNFGNKGEHEREIETNLINDLKKLTNKK